MTTKVELGFTPSGGAAPFFTLDDAIKGLLDSPLYVLGGEVLADVSEYVKSVSINRGKSLELDRFRAGAGSVQFNNDTRVFDPSYTLSPYYGQIQPKRRLRISVDDVVQFDGTIDDWDIDYNRGGYSVATANAVDATQNLTGINLEELVVTEQLAGARVNTTLDAISWDADRRDIATGSSTLAAQTVAGNTNTFNYLQTIAQSEPGDLFISKEGNVKFVDRYAPVTGDNPAFADDGTGIEYTQVSTIIGSELLYNNITVTSTAGTSNAVNQTSIDTYGEIDYELATLLSSQTQLDNLASFLLNRYSEPRYRISDIGINLRTQSAPDRATILDIELGDIVQVTFTPSGISPAFVTFAKVIRIQQNHSPELELFTFGLEALSGVVLVLNDPEFGKLDEGYFLSGPYNAWTLNDAIYGRLSAGMAVS